MRSVLAIDAAGIHGIEQLIKTYKKKGSTLVLSHINEQPMDVLKKSGILQEIGEENIFEHIDAALERAAQLTKSVTK